MIQEELETLLTLFRRPSGALGSFEALAVEELPVTEAKLLAHSYHMTVTLEEHFQSPVQVEVLRKGWIDGRYCREILLRLSTNRRVVLFGIVRLNTEDLPNEVLELIVSERIPLGRILIQNNVLREVECRSLWRVSCGVELAKHLECSVGSPLYGRTACIHLHGKPSLQLLELLAPPDRA